MRYLQAPVLALLAAACTEAPGLNPVEAADPPQPVEQAASTPRQPIADDTPDVTARLVEVMRDRAREQDPPDTRTDSPAWQAFYDPNAVHEVRVSLTEDARDDLQSDGRTWVPAVVTIDGVEFPNAGVRRKGNTTWQSLNGKPSLKIKLREFGDGPRLAGLERLTLNNMVSDPSQARENIALRLWAALGATASRSSWARVWIDDEPYGLYSNIEALDDEWLQRRYLDPGGDLWEANDDADFTEGGLPYWELSEGVGDAARLTALAEALADRDTPYDARVADLVNLDQFLAHWATCLVTGMTDGYPFKRNDVFVYADPANDGRLEFVPWGMDEAWGDLFNSWTAGELAAQCEDDATCEARLRAAVTERLDTLATVDVDRMITEAYDASAPFVADDPKRPFSAAEVSAARAELRARIAGWPARVRAELGL